MLIQKEGVPDGRLLGNESISDQGLDWGSPLKMDGSDLERHYCDMLDALGRKGKVYGV